MQGPAAPPPLTARIRAKALALAREIRSYFVEQSPTFSAALLPFLVLSALLYTRDFRTNFIFDEQEALLANPYVNGKHLPFFDVVRRDFWGLPPDRSIGSYRPLPNVLWRLLADGTRAVDAIRLRIAPTRPAVVLNPWVFHWSNVVLHAVNAALLAWFVHRATRQRSLAWLSGTVFAACAVLTEAVSGVVGTADVLGGLGALLALAALVLPLWAMPFGVFGAMLFGLFSKESALVCVPLVPLAALLLSPTLHPDRPLRAVRSLGSLAAAAGGFVLYVTLRKHWYPSPLPVELTEPLDAHASSLARALRAFLVWFHQPSLPRDPLNNPLVQADAPHRVAGALRVYFRSLGQLVFPKTLSGDYSFRAEPVPDRLVFGESVLGALGMVLPLLAATGLWIRALLEERRDATSAAASALLSLGLAWVVISYLPHSNIVILLPTVRAERFMYFPAIGSSIVIAAAFAWAVDRARGAGVRRAGIVLVTAFLGFQGARARTHAFDYTDDLVFWGATKDSVPLSAKAHLNYSVMWGARGNLDTRLAENRIAVDLAPTWPMAHIYLGDTLCRMHRAAEAWAPYAEGFRLGHGEPNLIALALQCLWDEKALEPHQAELLELGAEHPGSWLDFLAKDIVENGEENHGVDPKYRPRGYNEGPKE